jgi:hypothetical protein
MKKILIITVSPILLLLSCLTTEKNHWQTQNANGGIAITGYSGNDTDITIPGEIGGLAVVEIGEKAFYNKLGITKIVIPSGVTSIGNLAFAGNNLTNVTIPPGVTSIGDGAFAINELTSITIPASVRDIGKAAFARNPLSNISITLAKDFNYAINLFDETLSLSFWDFLIENTGDDQLDGTYVYSNGKWSLRPK